MAGLNGTPTNGARQGGLATSRDESGLSAAMPVHPLGDAAQDEVAMERSRLESEIAAAKARTAAAQHRAAAAEVAARAEMRAELHAARVAVEEMERQHEASVAMVRKAAQIEAERILAEARQRTGPIATRLNPSQAWLNDAQ